MHSKQKLPDAHPERPRRRRLGRIRRELNTDPYQAAGLSEADSTRYE